MNHHDDVGSSPLGDGDGRVEEVLRTGGAVEHVPPAHVWDAIVGSLPGARATGSVAGDRVGSSTVGRRRRWAAGSLLAAAAVGAAVTWVGIELADREAQADLVVSGALNALTDDGTQGRAEVVEVDGQRRLRIELADRPDAGAGYLEVWLLRPDVSGMVTLGVLEGERGDFLLPEGLDLAEFAVVDISREDIDGDPGHGGDSLVRGQVG